MNRLIRAVAGVCVAAGLMACPPKPAGNCGGTACTATERCDADSLKCVADAAPIITLDSPPVVSTATFTVTGTITDDAQVTSAEWRTGTRPFTSIDLQSGGAFTLTVDAPVLDAENIVLTLRASDGKNETTLSRDVKIDRVGPTVELQSPDAGSAHNTASITVALKVTDGSGALSELSVDGQMITNPMSGATVMTSVAVPASANNTLLEVPVVAADSRGNRTMTSLSFYGDRIAPVVAISSPVASDLVATPMMTVVFTATDPSALTATCAGTTGSLANATTTDGMNWTCVLPVAVEERPETVSVVVTDAAGNSTTQMVAFAIDRIAPTVTFVSPTANTLYARNLAARVTTSPDVVAAVASMTHGEQSVDLEYLAPYWEQDVNVDPDKDYATETLEVRATDAAGNVGSASISVITDSLEPRVTIVTPTSQQINIASLDGGTTVRVQWTVTDADPVPPVVTFNGATVTTNFVDRPTSPTDNPGGYNNIWSARDRAGNVGGNQFYYEVDRVAPTVASWTPAANSRNLDATISTIRFSEPVRGPAHALSIAQAPQLTGTWDSFIPPTEYTLSFPSLLNQVIDIGVAPGFVDFSGNPLVMPPARKVHIATQLPGLTTIRSNVAQFAAASDGDGIAFVATIDTSNTLDLYRDTGGGFTTPPRGSLPATASRVAVNAWNVVNPTTLISSSRYGVAAASTSVGGSVYSLIDGVATANTFATARLGVITVPPFPGETSSSPVGLVSDNVFARAGGGNFTLPHNGGLTVTQSSVSWNAFDSDSGHVYFSHFACRPQFGGGFGCGGVSYGSATSNPSRLQGAVTHSGSCSAMTWQSGSSTFANFLARPACDTDLTLCVGNTSIPPVTVTNDVRFASGGPSTPNSLLFSYRSATNTLTVAQTTPGTCDFTFSILFNVFVPGAKEHLPIRIGAKTGILFVTAANDLSLYVPP